MNFARIKKLLGSAISVVALLFAAFAGVLVDLAPPVTNVAAKVGLANLILLTLLLLIALYSKDRIGARYNNVAAALAGIFLVLGLSLWLWYINVEADYVFSYPPQQTSGTASRRHVRGELHDKGKELVGNSTVTAAVMDNGGLSFVTEQQLFWTEASQHNVEFKLTAMYLGFVSLFGASIFFLLVRLVDAKPGSKSGKSK
ncbi:MAG: hypothetical protein HYS38_06995 [Acidobacteria bacterium]|nr:hypothetical protein [Acidobacteriota bacterium]